ncbi:MAG TPA: hypothetical protein VGF01_04260 [Terracidiphilus sp.]
MYSISAVDSISLAIQRTKEFLFQPFRWVTYLKLGLVAIITEGIGSNLHSSSHGGQPLGDGSITHSPLDISPAWIAAIVAAVLIVILLSTVVFYLVTRLRFAFFHCLIHKTSEIGPGWRLYRTQAARFFWLNLGVGFCFLLLLGAVAIPFVAGFVKLFHEMPPGGPPDMWLLLSLILPLIPVILLMVLMVFAADVILRDFVMPHYALDDATAGEAWEKVWEHIKTEKGQFAVYALLRLILPIAATIVLFIVLFVPGLMLVGAGAAIGYSIHSAFADTTGASAVVGVLLQIFFGVIAFGFALLAGICLGGPLSTGIREYALTFYGGRYEPLGEILYPPPSASVPGIL